MIKLIKENIKNLYFLQDSTWFSIIEKKVLSEYLSKGYVPTEKELISSWINDEYMSDFMKSWDEARSNLKSWQDIKRVDMFAKHIINLISSNISYNESISKKDSELCLHEDVYSKDDFNALTEMIHDMLDTIQQRVAKCEKSAKKDYRLGFPPTSDDESIQQLALIRDRLVELEEQLEMSFD